MKGLELYVHTGGEGGEPVRFFLCRPGVDNNVAEVFETADLSADEAAAQLSNAVNAVTQIVALLDGKEWNSETICDVANVLRENCFPVRDLDDQEEAS